MKVYESYQGLTRQEIENIEYELKVSLPEEYKWFLMNVHAIQIETTKFTVNDRDYRFSHFLTQSKEYPIELIQFNKEMKQHIGNDFIVFAFDSETDFFLLSVKQSDKGTIYYLRGDLELKEGLRRISNSFNEFVSLISLKSEIDESE